MPWDEHLFWALASIAAGIAILTPAFRIMSRLGKIEKEVAAIRESVDWLKHFIYQDQG